MELINTIQNVLNMIVLGFIINLVSRGRTLDALMVMLVGVLCAPLNIIGGQAIPFAYLASAVLLAYVFLDVRRLKIPRNNFVFLLSAVICSSLFVEWLSTMICVFAYAPLSVEWLTLLGRLRGVLVYSLSVVLAYSGLRNHPDVDGRKLSSKLLSALGISMFLNLIAVGVQVVHPQFGFHLVRAWYTSESRITIDAMEKIGMFSRFYGLNYSPVHLGFKSLLSFGGALFYMLMSHNAALNRKAIAVVFLTVINGALSFSKTFILGSVLCILVFWPYHALQKLRHFPMVRIGTTRVLVVCCLFVGLAIIVVNVDKLQAATGLPFVHYFGKIAQSPLDAFSSRYRYQMAMPSAQLAWEVIQAHPLLGVGMTSMVGEFIGDSEYLVAMHNGGIVALFLRLIEIGVILYVSLSRRLYMFFGLWLVSAMVGFAIPTLSTDLCLCLLGIFAGYVASWDSAMLKRS